MNALLLYYLWLSVGFIIWLAWRQSTLKTRPYIHGGILTFGPILLILQTLNLRGISWLAIGFSMGFLLNWLFQKWAIPDDAHMVLRLTLWFAEVLLPLPFYFGLRSHVELEQISLVIVGLFLLALSLLYFLILEPTLEKRR
jgi:hypothetical protein